MAAGPENLSDIKRVLRLPAPERGIICFPFRPVRIDVPLIFQLLSFPPRFRSGTVIFIIKFVCFSALADVVIEDLKHLDRSPGPPDLYGEPDRDHDNNQHDKFVDL